MIQEVTSHNALLVYRTPNNRVQYAFFTQKQYFPGKLVSFHCSHKWSSVSRHM